MEAEPDSAQPAAPTKDPEPEGRAGSSIDQIPDELPGLGADRSEIEEPVARRQRRAELADELARRPARSAMLGRLGWLVRWISSFLFAHVLLERRSLEHLRDVSKSAPIVYVMRSRSLLDYLYFNWAFLEHDLPLARFANGLSTAWLRGPLRWLGSLFGRHSGEHEEAFEALVERGEATFLFLERPRKTPEAQLEFSQPYLFRLIRAQRRLGQDEPILVVPLLLLWARRPDPQHVSFLDDVFGTPSAPGFFRKAWGVLQTLWQSFFNLGQPLVQVSPTIDLRALLREYPGAGSADASELTRERLLEVLTRERQVILGPTGLPPEQTFQASLVDHPEIRARVTEIAEDEGADEMKVRERVRTLLRRDRRAPEHARAQDLLAGAGPGLLSHL